jgi:tetratricopeptide (TPR) repeat protein
MRPIGTVTRAAGIVLILLCLPASAPIRARQDDMAALAATLLAAPAPDRAKLLEQRHVAPGFALIDALLTIGSRRAGSGDLTGALDCYEYSLSLARSAGEQAQVSESLLGLGQVYGRRAEYDHAHATTQEALDVATKIGNDRLVAGALNNLGIIYRLQGDYEQARRMYGRVLTMAEAAQREDQISRALGNLGIVETYQGMYDAAVTHLERALEISLRTKNESTTLNQLLNLGNVYYYQNNCTLALDFYQRVLTGAERAGNQANVLSSLTNIAACERSLLRFDAARDHLTQVLGLAEAQRLPAEIARAHYGLATLDVRQQRWEAALGELAKSLETREAIGDRLGIAESLVSKAEAQTALGDQTGALESVRRAGTIADELDLPEVAYGARTAEGRILAAQGRAADAEAAYREAIQRVETTRDRVAGSAIDRVRYLAVSVEPYAGLASLLARGGRGLDALAVAEQAHARALAEVLAGHPADDVLTPAEGDRQHELQQRLGSLNRDIEALPSTPAAAARAKELAASRRAARLALDEFNTSLYAAHPELRLRYGAPPALTAATLARRLDRATVIVEFVESADATLLLTATAGSHGPVVRARTIAIGSHELDARVAAFDAAIARRDLGVGVEARALGALLLDRALVAGKTRLVIVPDGALWTLPFHALKTPADRYVVEDHVVSYAPSIVALQLLGDRQASAPARGGFLGIADPDPAHPLPESRRQVEALVAGSARPGRALTGSAATEAAVRKAIESAHVIHVASHGVFEDASPLYSHIVLAPGDGTDTSDDGRLEAWELMRLPLRASLVTLAACETGRGDIRSGEGVIGLSWAALAAGAPAAVVSLWRVDERATTAWMTAFYRSWETVGASRAASDAARALLASDQYRHPFYWAPFVVIGDPSRTASARLSQPPPAAAARPPTGSPHRP